MGSRRRDGRPYDVDPATLGACLSFTAEIVEQGFDAYGPPVAVDDAAPPLDRLLGLAGRDPSWAAPTSADERRDAIRTADRSARAHDERERIEAFLPRHGRSPLDAFGPGRAEEVR